jgi:mono/diheme cytochrome c family protein
MGRLARTLAIPLLLAAGCAEDDPPYGAPDSIRGRVVEFGPSTSPAVEAGAGAGARELFTANVYPSIRPTCASCHTAGGTGPTFLGADADASLSTLKTKGYDRANSQLVAMGKHTGPALTPAQLAMIAEWHAAEARGDGGGG